VLSKRRRPNEIRQALKDLPKGLDATYHRILTNIDPDYQRQVASTLKWLAFSLRPLTLDEVAEIFILDHENNPPFDEGNKLFQPEDVLNYLPSLVTKIQSEVSRPSEIETIRNGEQVIEIRLAHFSIKEYLTSARINQGPAKEFSTTEMHAHLHISEACLAYHLHLSQITLVTEEEYRRLALWEYIVQNWHRHLERVPQNLWTPFVTGLALKLLAPKSQGLLNMIRISDPDNYKNEATWDKTFDQLSAPLYYTAALDAVQIMAFLLDKGHVINEQSRRFCGFALQVAAWKGHQNAVNFLLDRGADINATGGYYGTALQAAVYGDSESIAKLLLDRGANINAQGGFFGNALQAASFTGYKSMVQLMLDRGADFNAKGGRYGSALQAAIAEDEIEIVELLLLNGAVGPRWEELLGRVKKDGWNNEVEKFLKFQKDPSSYIITRTERRNRI
jgi:hypothetical protein